MNRLLTLLCGFLFVLCGILAGLLFKKADGESADVNVSTNVSINTPGSESGDVRVEGDSGDASRVRVEIDRGSNTSAPGPGRSADEVLRDVGREDQDRRLRQKRENLDELIQRGVRVAADAQSWALRPAPFGGAEEGETIADAQFSDLGYPNINMGYANVHGGVFQTLEGDFQLSRSDGALIITGENRDWDNRIRVVVRGTAPADIDTQVLP